MIYIAFIVSCNANRHSHENDEHSHENDEHEFQTDDHSHSSAAYKVIELEPMDFSFIYKTSGQVLLDRKDDIVITASSPGLISFSDHFLYPGVELSSGEEIFFISGSGLTEYNTEIIFQKLESEYESAKTNYERAKRMFSDQLITEEHFLNQKLAFEKTSAEYLNYLKSSGVSGTRVLSPVSGFVKELFVTEGQMVKTGDKIASIIIEHNMILKADIPPADLGILPLVQEANFSTGYSQRIFSTNEMDGRLISYGRSTGDNSYFIPIYFRINYNSDLIPGTFADIWLIGNTLPDVIAIPNGSIMEEFGKFYVFREIESGSFEKRYITIGKTDGRITHVVEGLKAGERIVSEGAYSIKLALQSTAMPSTHIH